MPKKFHSARLKGIVTAFSGNGRKLGYPTANLSIATTLEDGVYFGFATMNGYQAHPAMIFVGVPTTVGDKLRRVEAHLLDIADNDYYGEQLHLSVHYFHRPNQKFADVEQLVQAIQADEAAARQWFKEHELAPGDHLVDT